MTWARIRLKEMTSLVQFVPKPTTRFSYLSPWAESKIDVRPTFPCQPFLRFDIKSHHFYGKRHNKYQRADVFFPLRYEACISSTIKRYHQQYYVVRRALSLFHIAQHRHRRLSLRILSSILHQRSMKRHSSIVPMKRTRWCLDLLLRVQPVPVGLRVA
jgi:hypothetical protein